MKKHRIILDCDNTMGVPHCDVDDGLTLLYLHQHPDCELLGVTLTFGNSDTVTVDHCTRKLFKDFALDLPLIDQNDAPDFLIRMSKKYDGELIILATGSTNNLARAVHRDPEFIGRIKAFYMMGGLLEPLRIHDKIMDELNFSVDWKASLLFFDAIQEYQQRNPGSSPPVTILTGNNCLKGGVTREELNRLLTEGGFLSEYLLQQATPWFDYHMTDYDIDYIIIWDLITAVAITRPELFKTNIHSLSTGVGAMQHGFFAPGGNLRMNFPEIIDRESLAEEMISGLLREEPCPKN